MKQNRTIKILLGAALLGVWGAIAYQFFSAVSAEDDGLDEGMMNERFKGNNTRLYEYKADVRDPFQLVPAAAAKKVINKPLPSPYEGAVWVPPPYRLNGVIINDQKRVAILEGSDGGVYFLSEGDSAGNVRILNIANEKVTYSYLKKQHIWEVE